MELDRPARLQLKANLPKVNRELAEKLMSDNDKKNKNKSNTILTDDRFKVLFHILICINVDYLIL